MTSGTVLGSCDARFEPVREQFARGFGELASDSERGEIGASLAVIVDGIPVVDLWGGHADADRTRAWKRDTLANVYSTTKGVTAAVTLRLVDEGLLDLDAPVASYWAEFSAGGKEEIPVVWLLSHQAGLPALREPLPHEAIYDSARISRELSAEKPWWNPGERHGYHAFTFGWLLGELVRRVAGRSLGTIVREQLAVPLGLDLHIGVPASDHTRAADLTPVPLAPGSEAEALVRHAVREPDSATARAFGNPPGLLAPGVANTPAWRSAEIPAANAHTTARALARLYAALAGGGSLDAVRVLSPGAAARCHEETAGGFDEVLRMQTRFGHGFMLSSSDARFGPGRNAFGHPGAGGSLGLGDPDARIGFGYVPNRMGSEVLLDPRPAALLDTTYACL